MNTHTPYSLPLKQCLSMETHGYLGECRSHCPAWFLPFRTHCPLLLSIQTVWTGVETKTPLYLLHHSPGNMLIVKLQPSLPILIRHLVCSDWKLSAMMFKSLSDFIRPIGATQCIEFCCNRSAVPGYWFDLWQFQCKIVHMSEWFLHCVMYVPIHRCGMFVVTKKKEYWSQLIWRGDS